MTIILKNINKYYQNYQALDNLSLSIKQGELTALIGPSGSGKTTLLRIIAGLEMPSSGEVIVNNKNILNQSIKARKIGFVFQNYALFNHLTVRNNIAFGLKILPNKTRPSKDIINHKVNDLLMMMHLNELSNRYPNQLSGGQKQRVALARALAIEPNILLLDEPFSALDAKVRKELRSWLRRLHNEMNITTIIVTHDQEEAMEVADKIIIMNKGIIEQIGTPEIVYNQPVNAFVYDFLGDFNIFTGWQDENQNNIISDYELIIDNPLLKYQPSWFGKNISNNNFIKKLFKQGTQQYYHSTEKVNSNILTNKLIKIFARPHQIEVTKTPVKHNYIITRLIHVNPAGPLMKLELERKNKTFIYAHIDQELYQQLNIQKGDLLYIRPTETIVFDN